MPDFYVIIARKIFSRFLGPGHVPVPHSSPPVSYTYRYPSNVLIVNFTNIIVPMCVVGKCQWVIDGHAPDDVT